VLVEQVYAQEWVRGVVLYDALQAGGDPLDHQLVRRMFPWDDIVDRSAVTIQLARGLRHLHELGVYHLDLKPSNVLVSSPLVFGWMAVKGELKLHRPVLASHSKEEKEAVIVGQADKTLAVDGYATNPNTQLAPPSSPLRTNAFLKGL
jgi:hypothetical protein